MAHVRGQSGITLVELMVALTIWALLFNFAFNIYLSSWRMYRRGLAAVKINTEARYALGSFARDIESAYPQRAGGAYRFRGEDKELRDVSGLPLSADSLSLMVPLSESYLMRNGGPSSRRGLKKVYYFLERDKAGGQGSLKKNIYLFQAGNWVKDGSVTLTENVREIDFKYYDGARWVAEWDAELPPKAVKVNLVVHDESNTLAPRRLSTIVGIATGGGQ